MKKAILAMVATATLLVACNNTTTTPATVDSAKVDTCKVDSCKAKCDSTEKVDTAKAK